MSKETISFCKIEIEKFQKSYFLENVDIGNL